MAGARVRRGGSGLGLKDAGAPNCRPFSPGNRDKKATVRAVRAFGRTPARPGHTAAPPPSSVRLSREHMFDGPDPEPRAARPRRHDPPRRPRRLLRLGRATRRPASAGPSGHRRRRGRPRGELRSEGLWRADRDGRNPGATPVPPRDRRRAEDVRLLRGEQGGVPGVRGDGTAGRGAVDRRGVPGRPRSRPHIRLTA